MVLNSNLFWNPIYYIFGWYYVRITFMDRDTTPPSKVVKLVVHQNLQEQLCH